MKFASNAFASIISCLLLHAVALPNPAVGQEAKKPAAEKSANGKSEKETIPADESPKDAMFRITKVMEKLDLDKMFALYECANQPEEELARANLKEGLAMTRIELAARKQFGRKEADDIVHKMGGQTDADLKDAKYKIDGDHASIQFPGESDPSGFLIRIKGVWMLDMHADVKGMTDDDIKNSIRSSEKTAASLKPIVEKLEKGDFKTPADLLHEVLPVLNGPIPEMVQPQKK
jgi:hypothetical protein